MKIEVDEKIFKDTVKQNNEYKKAAIKYDIVSIVLFAVDFILTIVMAIDVMFTIPCLAVKFADIYNFIRRTVKIRKVCANGTKALKTFDITKELCGDKELYNKIKTKRETFMKTIRNWIKNNPMTILFSVIGFGVMFYLVYAVMGIYELPVVAKVLTSVGSGVVSVTGVVLLGADKKTMALLRKAYKKLTPEKMEAICADVTSLIEKEEEKEKVKSAFNKAEKDMAKIAAAQEIINKYKDLFNTENK